MRKKTGSSLLKLAAIVFLAALAAGSHAPSVNAADPVPGASCSPSGKFIRTGEGGTGYLMVCDGTKWLSIVDYKSTGRSLMRVGNDTGTCTAAKKGRMSYNDATDIWKYCTGSSWKNLQTGASPTTGTPGTSAGDNTVFVGYAPIAFDGIYVTKCDAGLTWNGSACTGTAITRTFGTYGTSRNTGMTDGKTNTAKLVAFGETAHPAAWYCDNLVLDGYDDWYLPSYAEMLTVIAHRADVGTFSTDNLYMTSSDNNSTTGYRGLWHRNGYGFGVFIISTTYMGKSDGVRLRCVRKD